MVPSTLVPSKASTDNDQIDLFLPRINPIVVQRPWIFDFVEGFISPTVISHSHRQPRGSYPLKRRAKRSKPSSTPTAKVSTFTLGYISPSNNRQSLPFLLDETRGDTHFKKIFPQQQQAAAPIPTPFAEALKPTDVRPALLSHEEFDSPLCAEVKAHTLNNPLALENEAKLIAPIVKFLESGDDSGIQWLKPPGASRVVGRIPSMNRAVVFKVDCMDQEDTMHDRYQRTSRLRFEVMNWNLTRITVPAQKLVPVKIKGFSGRRFILLETFISGEERPISGEQPEDLELFRQIGVLSVVSQYWKITPKNNPFISGTNKLVIRNVTGCKPWRNKDIPPIGFHWQLAKSIGFFTHLTTEQKAAVAKGTNAAGWKWPFRRS